MSIFVFSESQEKVDSSFKFLLVSRSARSISLIFAILLTLSTSPGQLLATNAVVPGEKAPLIPPAGPVMPVITAESAMTSMFVDMVSPARPRSGSTSPITRALP